MDEIMAVTAQTTHPTLFGIQKVSSTTSQEPLMDIDSPLLAMFDGSVEENPQLIRGVIICRRVLKEGERLAPRLVLKHPYNQIAPLFLFFLALLGAGIQTLESL